MRRRINESEMGVLICFSKGNLVAKLVPGGVRLCHMVRLGAGRQKLVPGGTRWCHTVMAVTMSYLLSTQL